MKEYTRPGSNEHGGARAEGSADYAVEVGANSTSVLEVQLPERAGRAFQPVQERELHSSLRSLAGRLPGVEDGLILSPEFAGPRGVVDLLAVTRTGAGMSTRANGPAGFLSSEADAVIVAATHAHVTRTAEFLSRRLGLSLTQVSRRLRALTAAGFVVRVGGGYRRAAGLEPVGRAYALEAKVRDWRRGFEQALRYASWCDAAGVVLLTPPTHVEETAAQFQAFGIGLAVGDSWVVRPRMGRPDPGRRLLLSEILAAAVADATVHRPSAVAYSSSAAEG